MKKQTLIHPIPSLQDNYIWALIELEQRQVCLVDPGDANPAIKFLDEQQLNLQAIILTHHHWDHTQGVGLLKDKYQVPVYGPANPQIPEVTQALSDQEEVPSEACSLRLRVFAIPGHTLDHLAYYAPRTLFCGDTLFAAGCGRLFEGSALQMYNSLQKMAALPEDTQVYCAHEYTLNNLRFAQTVEPANSAITERIERVKALREKNLPSLPSTLGEEKQTNPFLRCDWPQVKAGAESFAGQALTTPIEVFSWVRKWKDSFK